MTIAPLPADEGGSTDGAGVRPASWLPGIALAVGLLLLVLSFLDYYRYDAAKPLQEFCRASTTDCPSTLGTVDAWHGVFGWLAVVLALLGALCVAVSAVDASRRRILSYATVVLYGLATASLLAAVAVVPDVGGSTRDLERTLGPGVHYSDLVSNQHAWGFWASLVLVVIGLGCAVLDAVTLRAVRSG
jgi:hypothetical protein